MNIPALRVVSKSFVDKDKNLKYMTDNENGHKLMIETDRVFAYAN
jgi:hypothetical protein